MFKFIKTFKDAMVDGAIKSTVEKLETGELKVDDPQAWIAQTESATTMSEVWNVLKAATAEHTANGGG